MKIEDKIIEELEPTKEEKKCYCGYSEKIIKEKIPKEDWKYWGVEPTKEDRYVDGFNDGVKYVEHEIKNEPSKEEPEFKDWENDLAYLLDDGKPTEIRDFIRSEKKKSFEKGYKDGYDFECECGERIIKARDDERTKVINEIRLEIASYSKLGVEQTKYLLNKLSNS